MNTLASRTYRLLALILHPLNETLGVATKRFALEICQFVRVAKQKPALAGCPYHGVGETFTKHYILHIVEVRTAFPVLLFLSLSSPPFFLILLVELKELCFVNEP